MAMMLALGHTIRPTKGFHSPDGPYVEYEARWADERLSTEAKDALPVSVLRSSATLVVDRPPCLPVCLPACLPD